MTSVASSTALVTTSPIWAALLLRLLGPSITSTALLLETPGAALIAALWLGQTPHAVAYPALAVILVGLALVVPADRRKPS
ncbi:hypothetical protein [Streptomyces sp. ME19-01-6]|uniref:hypothetical protein n=1 Tax=Streptomyces sp. ME19-01-6 TaxID=3028686 RepID=UPI0029A33C7E|nr:hypothetical protein [Streptomyces sp. ME19-01-6]MDX3225757.1 hypothetical protein [Streptomyces sp. ME19-01-6]